MANDRPARVGAPAPAPRLPTVDAAAKLMLDKIAEAEGTGEARAKAAGCASGYEVVFGYRPTPRPLTAMSLDEVDALQAGLGAHTPVGRYQITRATLRGLRRALGLTGRERFDAALQDALGRRLMSWAGWDRPGITPAELQRGFARTWASIADLDGESVGAGQRVAMDAAAFARWVAAARASA